MINRIRRGIPGHPGTPVLAVCVALGALAGAEGRGGDAFLGALIGASVMLAGLGPLWLFGAWKGGERREEGSRNRY